MILKVFLLIKNIFFNFSFAFFHESNKTIQNLIKIQQFQAKKYKIWQNQLWKIQILAFLGHFFRFQGKFLSLEFFIWHTLKQQIKTRHLEKIPAQKNHFNSSYDFFYLIFYPKRQFLAVFALKRAKLIFFFSKLTMLSVIEG